MWELTSFLDSNAPYLSLATHGTNIAAGTELSHSQAAVLIWSQPSLKSRCNSQTSSSLLQGHALSKPTAAELHRKPQRRRDRSAIPSHSAQLSAFRQHGRPRQHLRHLPIRRRRRSRSSAEPRQLRQPRRLPLQRRLLRPEPR